MSTQSPFADVDRSVFVMTGLTDDSFCVDDARLLPPDVFLHEHLREVGFSVILFVSHDRVYFLDDDSERAIMEPEGLSSTASVCPLANAPGGLTLRKQTAAPNGFTPRFSYRGLQDSPELALYVRRALLDVRGRAAVVIHAAPHLLRQGRTATLTLLENVVTTDLLAEGHATNRNILVFRFSCDRAALAETLRATTSLDWLVRFDGQGRPQGVAALVDVAPPGRDEIGRLIDRARLLDGLQVDWENRETLEVALAGHARRSRLHLKAVQRSLAPLSLLDPAAVEALTGEPAGAHAWQALEELRGMDDLVAYLRGLAEERRLDAPAGEPQRRHIERLCGTEPPTRRRNLHMMLVGPPGTGKTTAAHLVGRVYRAAGLLPLGHLHKVTRKDLVGAYQGHSAIRTDEAVRAALGGVLFVDEAYDLWHGDGDAFGIEALNTLLEAMSARQGELAVILAGYPADMERLFTANSGFGRRVPEAQRFSLPPAKPEELVSVFAAHVQRDSLLEGLTPALAEGLLPMFRGMVGEADAHFGNFGAAVNLFEACRTAAIRRGARTLDVEDFPAAQRRLLEQPETTPDGLLAQLDAMPGLLRAKAAIRTIAARLRYQRALAFDSARVGVGHMVFAGNPGTGKTSVARLFAEQLAALGVVQRRGLHETTARALIGRHVGDTENNTREFLEKGLGGVIFIDEAHQLERGGGASIDYGRQVIDELVPFAENHRHECVIVLAGYPAALARMMEYDEGLTGRFPGWIPFDDCSDDEMLQIVELLAERHEPVPLSLTAGARSALLRAFAQRRCEMGATFDNARGARTLLEASIGALALRFDPAVEKPPTTIEERDVPGSERARQGGDVSREDARWRNI